MTAVLSTPQFYDCRLCGSAYIRAAKHRGFCEGCWAEFWRWRDTTDYRGPTNENIIGRWLARRLMLDATRLARYGMTGRCEAVSNKGNRGWIDGLDAQCRNKATTMRDGRRICERHSMATAPVFIGSNAHDPYSNMQSVMAELAKKDDKFKAALVGALKESS